MRANSGKVSGCHREYSRFQETEAGDGFDLHCVVDVAVLSVPFSAVSSGNVGQFCRKMPLNSIDFSI